MLLPPNNISTISLLYIYKNYLHNKKKLKEKCNLKRCDYSIFLMRLTHLYMSIFIFIYFIIFTLCYSFLYLNCYRLLFILYY